MLLDVRPDHLELVREILQRLVPDREVWAFGSRAKWTARDTSDLDLCIVGDTPLGFKRLGQLRDAFSESRLPYKVDVVDWATTNESLRTIIERDKVVVQRATKQPVEGEAGEWVCVQLGEVAELLTGFPFKSDRYIEDANAPRLLRGDNVVQGALRWDGAKRWPQKGTEDVAAYQLREGDVVLAMDRPWIEAGLKYASVRDSDLPSLLVQRVARLRGNERLYTLFLKYVIGSRSFTDYVLSVQTGTAVPHISGGQIRSFEFPLPPLPEQRAIAHILGTLDDKIDLNRRMNETLEAMALALFKSWFVTFDPVRAKQPKNVGWVSPSGRNPPDNADGGLRGCAANPPYELPRHILDLFPARLVDSELGELPEGWGVKTVGDLAEVVGGSTPSTKELAYWDNGCHYWATPKDLSALTVPALLDTERRVTDAGLAQISSGLLAAGTVLLSSRAPIGYLAVSEVPVAINQGFIAMKPKKDVSNLFLLLWASFAHDEILSRANGSTFLEISKANFRPISVIAPPAKVMKAFDQEVRRLYTRIVESERESRTLAALRDTLLPKLISGELRVKDTEKLAGAVA